jgi:hypothetical protein
MDLDALLDAAKGAKKDRLVVLRLGLGRDSITMLLLLVGPGLIADGETIRPGDVDAVVFTDPGAEWPATYDLIPRIEKLTSRHGLRFIVQRKPPAKGPDGWIAWLRELGRMREARPGQRLPVLTPPWRRDPPKSIEARAARGYYHRRPPILDDYASRRMIILKKPADCTMNHKVEPGRELMDDLSRERFGVGTAEWNRFVLAGRRRSHLVLLGIAADEARRALRLEPSQKGRFAWEGDAYPLVEMGVTKREDLDGLPKVDRDRIAAARKKAARQIGLTHFDEPSILAAGGFSGVQKSGCMMCKYQDVSWYWALSVIEPAFFREVERWEAEAVALRGAQMALFPEKRVAKLRRTGTWNPVVARWKREGRPITVFEDKNVAYGFVPIREQVAAWRAENPRAGIEDVLAKEYERWDAPSTGLACPR